MRIGGKPSGVELDRMTIPKNRLHDIRSKETQSKNPAEVRSADTGFGGERCHGFSRVPHHHGLVLICLGDQPFETFVGDSSGIGARTFKQQSRFHTDPFELRGHR